MTSEKQLIANRANALKSTGPRSLQGKQRVGQNALKHGLAAKDAVTKLESKKKFEEYRSSLYAIMPSWRGRRTTLRKDSDYCMATSTSNSIRVCNYG